jgi:DNA-binding transcriptional LysR family regulator
MPDLILLPVFLAVAETQNFRAAADRLGVTRSAVSQAMRKLEDQLGVALVVRTTRSVRLTDAGAALAAALRGPFDDIGQALEGVAANVQARGVLRIAVTSIAERFLAGPMLARFSEAQPGVTLDVTVTDDEFDIVAEGFDAGVRLGQVIEKDMIAVAVSGPQREVAVAAPAYLAQHGCPAHPDDLIHHRCIGWRPAVSIAPYRWDFAADGQAFSVSVEPQFTTNDLGLMIRAALAGGGITFAPQDCVSEYLSDGRLQSVLTEFLPPFAGFYLFFPNRRHMPAKLRTFVDHVTAWNRRRGSAHGAPFPVAITPAEATAERA